MSFMEPVVSKAMLDGPRPTMRPWLHAVFVCPLHSYPLDERRARVKARPLHGATILAAIPDKSQTGRMRVVRYIEGFRQ